MARASVAAPLVSRQNARRLASQSWTWARRREQRGTLVGLGVFFAVRIVFWATGGGFSMVMLRVSYQLLDVRQLRAHPVQSVALLHIQPPLFNLFVGSVLRWSPISSAVTFQLAYLAAGVVIVIALRAVLLELGCPPIAATIGVCAVAVNPLLLGYENTITYEYPTAMFVVLSALLCIRYVRNRRVVTLTGFVSVLTITVLTRALFHPVWLAACTALVMLLAPPRTTWPHALAVLAIPLVLVGGWMLKNEVLFGNATLSSWFGMNLDRGVIAPMPRHDIQALIAERRLTRAALIPPLSPYSAYATVFGPCRSDFSEPVLRADINTTGYTNFNADCFLRVYADAQHNALNAVIDRPGVYLSTRWAPIAQHFSLPPVEAQAPGMDHVGHNVVMRNLARGYRVLQIPVSATVDLPGATDPLLAGSTYTVSFSLVVLLATLLVALRAGVSVFRVWRKQRGPAEIAWVFLGVTVLYVTIVSIATEYGENQRFRAMIDPILVGVFAAQLVAIVMRIPPARRTAPAYRSTNRQATEEA